MIDLVVKVVASELNEFFRLKFGLKEDRVIISNLVNQDGSSSVKDENRIILSLVLIQEEKTIGNIHQGVSKPVYINLFLLFSASFNEKLNTDALKFLTAVISFFQNKSTFNQQNTSNLNDGINKLTFEIVNQSFQEQSNLWSTLGAKYMPSILYKVRMIKVDENMLGPETIEIGNLDRNYENLL
jgi:hypothetical protein